MIRRWSPPAAEAADDRRIRDYVMAPGGISESAASLADKLGVSPRRCRRVLDELVKQGVLRRHEFSDIAPMYCRFPTLAAPPDTDHRVTAYTEADAAADDIDVGQMQGAPSPAR